MMKRCLLDVAVFLGLLLLGLLIYDHWRLTNVCHVAPQACWGIVPPAPQK